MRIFFLAVVTVFLAGCLGMGQGGLYSWSVHQVDLGGSVVSFEIPAVNSHDFPVFELPARIFLDDPGTFNEKNIGPFILDRHWLIGGRHAGSPDGLVDAVILLEKSDAPMHSEKDLQAAIQTIESLWWGEQKVGYGGRGYLFFDQTTVAGRPALIVRSTTASPSYAVRLDEDHFLEISLDVGCIDEYRSACEAVATRILSSLKITYPMTGQKK